MNAEHEMRISRTEISMIRWICGIKVNDKMSTFDPIFSCMFNMSQPS